MAFKVKGYKRLENRETIEVHVQNPTLDIGGLVHIKGREHGVYFNGKLCYVPRLCQIMDETGCDGMRLEVVDGKSFYFTLDESIVYSWTTGNPDSIQHYVWRNYNPYVMGDFMLAVNRLFDPGSRGNGTYFGYGTTRVYLNGKGSLIWSDMFREGNRIKKITWHWYYCATMDKYVKRLSEVWFVNNDINALKARLDIKPEDTNTATYIKTSLEQWAITKNKVKLNSMYGIKPVEFIPYDPSEFECKPSNNKEETKMSKTIKEVWDSMTREQQDACCVLIGEAAKKNSSLDYEIKKKVAAMKAAECMVRVKGTDIRDIVFNGPATIILWRNGSKTIVKQQKGDKWDPEKAVALAVMKKVFGTNETGSNYLKFVKPYIEKALEEHKEIACEEAKKDPADELVEMAQELIVDLTYGGATKAELVRAVKYSKELIDWLKAPAGGYVKTGSPTELLEKYGIAELREKYQKG